MYTVDSVVSIGRSAPLMESNQNASAGVAPAASAVDHVHPPVRSATIVTIGSDGTAVVTYTRKFDSAPCFVPGVINPAGRPVQVEAVSDILDAQGKFIGMNIKAYRSQFMPSLSGILLIGPLITALSGFDVLGGSAAGVQIRFTAFPQTVA